MKLTNFFPPEQHVVLENGLRVHLAPRPDFHQMAANLTVDFGGRDTRFKLDNEVIEQPAGVAHFLEHRLFGQTDYDAFQKLSSLGAEANAFTSQSRTSYYFTSLQNNLAALDELLTFTQTGYFSEDAVKREAQIIAQEADMYQDNVDAQVYRLLLAQLYPGDMLAQDIVGTHASLAQIDVATLETAFSAFYQPENMDVFITGAFDTDAVIATIKNSMSSKRLPQKVGQVIVPELAPVKKEPLNVILATNRTKVALGMRFKTGAALTTGREGLKEMIVVSLALDLVFGELSPEYMEWYNDALIDDDFSVEFEWERDFAFISIATDTNEPEWLIDEVSNVLNQLPAKFEALQDKFDLVKKDALGRTVNRFNFMEEIATSFEGNLFNTSTLMDEYDMLEMIDVKDVLDCLHLADNSTISSVIVHPNIE